MKEQSFIFKLLYDHVYNSNSSICNFPPARAFRTLQFKLLLCQHSLFIYARNASWAWLNAMQMYFFSGKSNQWVNDELFKQPG